MIVGFFLLFKNIFNFQVIMLQFSFTYVKVTKEKEKSFMYLVGDNKTSSYSQTLVAWKKSLFTEKYGSGELQI